MRPLRTDCQNSQVGCALIRCIQIVSCKVLQYEMFDGAGYIDVTGQIAAGRDKEHLGHLIHRCSARDASALRSLYDAMAPTMLGVALRMLRNRTQAEEILQEAFLQVWQNAERFDSTRGSAQAWMIGILRYRALDHIQSEKRHVTTGEVPDRPEVLDVSIEDSHALSGCMGELPDNWRRSIVLSYVEGYSHSEIANLIDTPLGTVKSWIFRSLEVLKRCLER